MAIHNYTVRVESEYGDFMEFPFEYEDFEESEDFDPNDLETLDEIRDWVTSNLYVDISYDG